MRHSFWSLSWLVSVGVAVVGVGLVGCSTPRQQPKVVAEPAEAKDDSSGSVEVGERPDISGFESEPKSLEPISLEGGEAWTTTKPNRHELGPTYEFLVDGRYYFINRDEPRQIRVSAGRWELLDLGVEGALLVLYEERRIEETGEESPGREPQEMVVYHEEVLRQEISLERCSDEERSLDERCLRFDDRAFWPWNDRNSIRGEEEFEDRFTFAEQGYPSFSPGNWVSTGPGSWEGSYARRIRKLYDDGVYVVVEFKMICDLVIPVISVGTWIYEKGTLILREDRRLSIQFTPDPTDGCPDDEWEFVEVTHSKPVAQELSVTTCSDEQLWRYCGPRNAFDHCRSIDGELSVSAKEYICEFEVQEFKDLEIEEWRDRWPRWFDVQDIGTMPSLNFQN